MRTASSSVRASASNRAANSRSARPRPCSQALQTSEQWWTAASSTARHDFLEGYYALNSPNVEKDSPVNKDCRTCKAQGTLKVTRNLKALDALCPWCHGAKYEQSVTYK